ncbi:MAG: butyrate kinase [Prevotellaceae bacterium]|jgi:butyrate kinase|nr:butyrate kinase [Prevotellaceae bacterium]
MKYENDDFHILTVNPGSTSTKIGIFNNEKPVFVKKIVHDADTLSGFSGIAGQYEYRKNAIVEELESANFSLSDIDIIMARGGLLKPVISGVYEINDRMLEELSTGLRGEHASNLGGLIAADLARRTAGGRAYIVDPVVVDEMQDVAKVAGHPEFKRVPIFHALNQKAIARKHAAAINRDYECINLIIAHIGGGVSIGAHCRGKVIDVNNALYGDGPLSPERSGSLPAKQVVDICFGGKYGKDEIEKMLVGEGGFMAYFGTSNYPEVQRRAENGDEQCRLIRDAMAYQTAKYIGSMAAVLKGDVDAILITGGVANDVYICNYISKMVEFIAPVTVYPNEDELSALAHNGLMLLKGIIRANRYE